MKKDIYSLLLVALFLSVIIGCSGTSSNKDSSKYDRPPYVVYTYDGEKEIVLYTNPNTATVNGLSGSWTDGHETSVNGECLEVQEYYIIWYGSKTCVIWPTKSMIFWGPEREALANLNNEARWTICHKKRM
jgi:hypothetical protein